MKTEIIYMKITADKYELPIAWADTPEELAKQLGIKSVRSLKKRCLDSNGSFRAVKIAKGEKDGR